MSAPPSSTTGFAIAKLSASLSLTGTSQSIVMELTLGLKLPSGSLGGPGRTGAMVASTTLDHGPLPPSSSFVVSASTILTALIRYWYVVPGSRSVVVVGGQ